MSQRQLSNQDIEEMDEMYLDRKAYMLGKSSKDRRSGKDRRVAINSCIDPKMDRRIYNRRQSDDGKVS